jgi:hypothetical protein
MSNGSKKRLLNFRVTDAEFDILTDYCARTGRTQTDVVRELVRQLARRDVMRHAPTEPQTATTPTEPRRTARRTA